MPLVIGSAIAWDPVLRLDALTTLSLSKALDDATLEENPGELARRLTLRVNNMPTAHGALSQLCALNQKLILYGDWGQGRQEVFRGTIYDWDFDPLQSDELTLTLYDDLYQLMHSKDQRYLQADTPYINEIHDTLVEFGFQIGTLEGPHQTALSPFNHRGEIGQYLINLLSDAAARGDYAYLLRMATASVAVDVILPGKNRPVYVFDQTLTDSARDTQSMDGLITEVRASGQIVASDDPLRAPFGQLYENPTASPKSNPPWPILRELLDSQQNGTPEAMQLQIDNIFRVHGAPKRTQRVRAVALPNLRKGDLVYIRAGTLEGYYGIVGVQINLKTDTMVLILNQSGTVDYPIQRLDPSVTGGLPATVSSGPPPPGGIVAGCSKPWTVGYPFRGTPYTALGPNIRYHRGVDLILPGANHGRGTPITFFQSATISARGTDQYGDVYVIAQMSNGLYSFYCHMDSIAPNVQVGAHVSTCDPLGTLGQTGTEGNPHLHFEIRRGINGDPALTAADAANLIDPTPYYANSVSG